MGKLIFPKEVVENSYEQIVSEYGKPTRILYVVMLVSVILIFVSTFFISADVGVTAVGMIKPAGEHVMVTASTNGKLLDFQWKENDFVHVGDTLCTIWSESRLSVLPSLQKRKAELEEIMTDMDILARGARPKVFQSRYCQQSYNYFSIQLDELRVKYDLSKKQYQRGKYLYENKMSAPADFEICETEFKKNELALRTLKRKQMAQWQGERMDFQNELEEIMAQIEQISRNEQEAVIIAPADGNVQSILNVKENSYVHAGQELLEISPDGELVAECYVASKDVGLLKDGMPVRLRIDAYDYTQWGFLTGKIEAIASDITVSDTSAFYKVICSLDNTSLTLKNGYQGEMKKGMGVSARMIVNRRTLFQLFFDKVDDWVNPTL